MMSIEKKSNKKKFKKLSIIAIAFLFIFYLIAPFIPNMFVKKGVGIDQSKSMQIVAHRGGAGIGLENTISCIEKGISLGANAIEVDIHLTKDGQLVVLHDQTVDRTTNGSGRIENLTLEEIKRLKIVDNDGNITDETIPTLNEVLLSVNGQAKLLVEIKKTGDIYRGIEKKLVEEVALAQASSWVIVQSFNDSVLEEIHKTDPGLRLEKLFIFKFPFLPYIFDGSITGFSFDKYSYISSFNIFHQSASKSLIKSIHEKGKEVKIWTLDEPENTFDLPVDGIITDRPDKWRQPDKVTE